MILYNSQILPIESLVLSIHSRWLQYGEALFETLLVENGEPVHLDLHLERAYTSCQYLFDQAFDMDEAVDAITEYSSYFELKQRMKIFFHQQFSDIDFFAFCQELPHLSSKIWQAQLELRTVSSFSFLKTVNYLDNLRTHERFAHKNQLAVWYTEEGEILEAPTANLVFGNEIGFYTPDNPNILRGVTRQILIDRGLIEEKKILVEDLDQYPFCFLCNSVRGLEKIQKIGDSNFALNYDIESFQSVL